MKRINRFLIWLISTIICGFIGTIIGGIYMSSYWWAGSLIGFGIPTFIYIADNF